MLASSRKPCDAANPRRRAKTPALHCGRERGSNAQTPAIRQARRGDLRQPGRALARSCAAPLSRLTPTLPVCGARIALRVLKHTCVLRPLRCREAAKTGAVSEGRSYAFYRRTGDNERSDGRLPYEETAFSATGGARLRSPLQGSLSGGSSPKASPARGGGCAARRRRRGALPLCDGNILQPPAGPCPASVGDDACIVPEALRRRRPPCGGRNRPALHCGHKQVPARKHQPAVRPAGGPMKSSAPTQGGSSPKASPARGGGCAARRRRRGALPLSGKNILQGPAGPCPASVRDDACIAPETLRCRKAPAADKPSAVTPAGSKFRW